MPRTVLDTGVNYRPENNYLIDTFTARFITEAIPNIPRRLPDEAHHTCPKHLLSVCLDVSDLPDGRQHPDWDARYIVTDTAVVLRLAPHQLQQLLQRSCAANAQVLQDVKDIF